jgi:hypothetical protein
MPDYRCLFLGSDGHIADVTTFQCADGAAALAQAAALLATRVPHHGAELWNLDKRIALFSWSTAKLQDLDSSRSKSLPRATITPEGR